VIEIFAIAVEVKNGPSFAVVKGNNLIFGKWFFFVRLVHSMYLLWNVVLSSMPNVPVQRRRARAVRCNRLLGSIEVSFSKRICVQCK